MENWLDMFMINVLQLVLYNHFKICDCESFYSKSVNKTCIIIIIINYYYYYYYYYYATELITVSVYMYRYIINWLQYELSNGPL